MKPINLILTLVTFTACTAWSSLAATGPRIVFDKPLTLNGTHLSLSVEKVISELDSEKNKWEVTSVDRDTRQCNLEIKVAGRDIALKNANLGEHYFGSMVIACPKDGLFSTPFTLTFSRVFFLGVRNCVESETMIDQDYCSIRAIALHKESDLQPNQGLIFGNHKKRKFYRIHAPDAQTTFKKSGLAPEGLNLATLDAYQIFDLSIGKTGREFFLTSTDGNLSNFATGRNQYLSISAEEKNRDELLKNNVQRSLDSLDVIVSEITRAAQPKVVFEAKIAEFISLFATTGRQLLAIISPVEYFQLEKRLKNTETALVELSKTLYPHITGRESFIQIYATQFEQYGAISGYFQPTRRIKNGAELEQAAQQTKETPRTPTFNELIGKEFEAGDRAPGDRFWNWKDSNYDWHNGLACSVASNKCQTFLLALPVDTRKHLRCGSNEEESKHWSSDIEKYCIIKIFEVKNIPIRSPSSVSQGPNRVEETPL